MVYANLKDARLVGANLEGAELSEANFTDAALIGTNLTDVNLIGIPLIEGEGESDAYRQYPILPDGTKWTPDTDMTRFTDPNHPDFW